MEYKRASCLGKTNGHRYQNTKNKIILFSCIQLRINNFITITMSKASSSRARSVSQTSSARRNQKFMTKWKLRSGNQSVLDNPNESADLNAIRKKESAPQRKARSYLFPNSCSTSEDFHKTSQNVKHFNFQHHNPDLCVCKDCLCGRHLCQLHNVKPDLGKNTIYKLDFLKKKPIPNKINISHEYDRLDGPHLDMDSIYNH